MQKSSFRAPLVVKISIIAAAVALYLIPLPRGWVERYYSEGLYPALQHAITGLSNKVPFAVFDLLTVGAVIGLIACWWIGLRRAGNGRRVRALPRLILNTAVFAASTVLLFLLMWGLNYRRIPLAQKLDYDRSAVTFKAAKQLAVLDVSNLNSLVKQVHSSPWPSKSEWASRIAPSFQSVVKALGDKDGAETGRPKVSIFNPYLSATGVDGFTDPFALEVILDSRLLPQEIPFDMAHEWAHLAGFADESEANFIALLTCLRSDDPAVRYVGWLTLYQSLPRSVFLKTGPDAAGTAPKPEETGKEDGRPNQSNRAAGSGAGDESQSELRLDPQVVADLMAIQNRLQMSIKPWLSTAESHVYDRYLKANRVEAGIASYGLFVRLVLGTKFGENWTPLLKAHSR